MRGNNVMGVIFSNLHEELIREITDKRTMGSVPFGGRYRLIDFVLSNMVNSGINKVGVVTKRNYQSLMDHLGSGKAWDLSRRRDGLFILPPFGNSEHEFTNRLETLRAIRGFLENSKEEYILLSDCDVVCNIDYQKAVDYHVQKQADVTIIYTQGAVPKKFHNPLVLNLDENNRVKELTVNPQVENICNYAMNMFILKRELLLQLLAECASHNLSNFKRDMLQANVLKLQMYGYRFSGFTQIISSMNSYFEANMELMSPKARAELFHPKRPIYTKVRDDMPAKYGLGASVKNSLIANGCVIEGEVENCILFRGVRIAKGAKVSNSIIMQDTSIGGNCNINYVIADKDILIKDERTLMGFRSYPVYISKASIV